MPIFERSSFNSQNSTPESAGSHSYDRIFALFNKGHSDQTPMGKSRRNRIGLKSNEAYAATVATLSSGLYQEAAGTDLGNIFFPFETTVGSGQMPSFASSVRSSGMGVASGQWPDLHDLIPFRWDTSQSGYVFDRYTFAASGDSYTQALSSDHQYPDIDRFRDISKIKSVGLRTPQIVVGVGYTTDGYPYPSGKPMTGLTGNPSGYAFKGGSDRLWTVDPYEYVAAPLDLRYDIRRNVWVGGPQGFWAQITGSGIPAGSNSGLAYPWQEVRTDVSGTFSTSFNFIPARQGDINNNPVYEANNTPVSSGTKIWILPRDRSDYFTFNANSNINKIIKISSSTRDGSNFRWKYGWDEVVKISGGYGGWNKKPNGLTGTSSANIGYNWIENMNGASGLFGNGVNSANLSGTFALQPVPSNAIVYATPVAFGDTLEYWFSYENGIDGGC